MCAGLSLFYHSLQESAFQLLLYYLTKETENRDWNKASHRPLEEIQGDHVRRDFLAVIPLLASKVLATFCIPPNPPDSDACTTGAICGSISNQQMEQLAGWG